MSVLACSRSGCEKVMCDHYLRGHGYICNSCLSELKDNILRYNSIGDFLNTVKSSSWCKEDTLTERLEKLEEIIE